MTTPDHPDERTDDVTATQPTEPSVPAQHLPPFAISSSLSARLAELEGDDDPLFDEDEDDDEEPFDEAPADAVTAPVSYQPQDAPEAPPTSYDDGAFDVGGAVSQDDAPDAAQDDATTVEEPHDEDAPATAALIPSAGVAAPPVIPAVPVDVPTVPVDVPTEPAAEPATEPATEPVAEPVDEADSAAEAAPAGGRARRARRRRPSVPVIALLLMTVLMAAATAFLWLQVLEDQRTEDARREGLNASRDAARLLFSYDYRTLEKDFSTGRALTTGEFRTQYDKTTTKVVTDVAKQYKAVVKANVVSAGVVRATPDTVVTVVYVNQVTTSTRVTGQKVDLSRVRMTLREVGGRWLVEAVNAL